MNSINIGSLDIVVTETPQSLRVVWKGEADERDPRKLLLPFLDEVTDRATAAGKKITLDFGELVFMNSACIGLAIAFLKALNEREVKVDVLYDTRHDWQTLSMKCTRTIFARTDNVKISDQAG